MAIGPLHQAPPSQLVQLGGGEEEEGEEEEEGLGVALGTPREEEMLGEGVARERSRS